MKVRGKCPQFKPIIQEFENSVANHKLHKPECDISGIINKIIKRFHCSNREHNKTILKFTN